MSVDGCAFCEVVGKQQPASYVYADEDVVAFMNPRPVTPGHLLVVPREHFSGLTDLDEAGGLRSWLLAHRLARALRHTKLRCEGVSVYLADGVAAAQRVPHVHLQVIPRFPGDDFRLDVDPPVADRADLDSTAAAVRAGVRRLAVLEPIDSGPTGGVNGRRYADEP